MGKRWIAAVALVGMTNDGAFADGFTDGNELLKTCQEIVRHMDGDRTPVVNPMGLGQCFGVLEGVRDTLTLLNEDLPLESRLCFPESGVNNGQAARIITKYLRDNPAQLHLPGAFLVLSAYKQAFPCK